MQFQAAKIENRNGHFQEFNHKIAEQEQKIKPLDLHSLKSYSQKKKHYPDAPAVIRSAWAALVPAIVELSHHINDQKLTVAQVVKRAMRYKKSSKDNTIEWEKDNELLNQWLNDIFILIGTLPFEASEANGLPEFNLEIDAEKEDAIDSDDQDDDFFETRLSRSTKPKKMKARRNKKPTTADDQISSQARAEAMTCIEMIASTAWYAFYVERKNTLEVRAKVLDALEYLYWECGIPSSISLLWDDLPDIDSNVFMQIRQYNHRQLYAIAERDGLSELIRRSISGTMIMYERRVENKSRFTRLLKKDPRQKASFSAWVDVIRQKYKNMGDA